MKRPLAAIVATIFLGAAALAAGAGKDPACVGSCGYDAQDCEGWIQSKIESCKDECVWTIPMCETQCEAMYSEDHEKCLKDLDACVEACPETTP